jgi:hypothetical protein
MVTEPTGWGDSHIALGMAKVCVGRMGGQALGAGSGVAVPDAALPFTGLIFGWKALAASALLLAGLALLRLVPRRQG